MNYKKGQILLITMLVLMVLAIVIVGIVIVTNRDIGQVTTNQKYEQLYNVAETELQRVVAKYGVSTVRLGDLSRDPDLDEYITDCTPVNESLALGYDCSVSDENALGLELDTEILVVDRKEIRNLEIYKDESITVKLEGYKQSLDVTWDQNVAMEFSMNFFIDSNNNGTWDQNEEIKEVSDIFDNFGVFNSKDPTNTFGFTSINSGRGVRFRINSISTLPANYYTRSITITPRTRENNPNPVLLSVVPSDPGSFPFQVRAFETTTYDTLDNNTPVVEVNSQVSLESQIDSIFNYSLITNGNISL